MRWTSSAHCLAARACRAEWPGAPAIGWSRPGGRRRAWSSADADRGHDPHRRPGGPGLPGRRGGRALAAAASPLSLGPDAGAPRRRRDSGDGGLATVRSGALSHVVGVGNAGRSRRAGGVLPARPRHHCRDGCSVAAGAGRERHRGHDRPRMDWSPVALGGRHLRNLGDRTGVYSWNRVSDTGRYQARGGARGVGMSERRVVVTGIGAVTPIGLGVAGLWDGLQRRRSAVRGITRFDPGAFKSRIAGEVDGFHATDHIEERRARRLDRFSQFSIAATRMALADAELDLSHENPDRVGAMMGTALGGVAHGERQYHTFLTEGPRAVDPALALTVFAGAASCNIAIEFGCTGPNSTNGMSCASGAIAIGDAFRAVARGEADVMIAGGAEAPLAPLCFGAFAIIRAMSTRNDDPGHASRPFDQGRDGFVMAEGAAVLVLEERGRALARGAPVYAEICGFGLTNDAHHMTAPRPDGKQAARAMRIALAQGGAAPDEIGYINAHGSSTPLNDPTETSSIKQVFGDHAYRLALSGTKGYYGHALGASGAIEAAICSLASSRHWLPPTVNLDQPDPACDLTHVTGPGLDLVPDYLLSNSFGFGGINAALLFRRAE